MYPSLVLKHAPGQSRHLDEWVAMGAKMALVKQFRFVKVTSRIWKVSLSSTPSFSPFLVSPHDVADLHVRVPSATGNCFMRNDIRRRELLGSLVCSGVDCKPLAHTGGFDHLGFTIGP